MHLTHEDEIRFKFRYIRGSQAAHIFRKEGIASPSGLQLGALHLGYESLADAAARDGRLFLVLGPEAVVDAKNRKMMTEEGVFVLQPSPKSRAALLERFIDRHASRLEVEAERKRLTAAGNGSLFRTAVCPNCDAAINLSELDPTPFTYCRFCMTTFSDDPATTTAGSDFRHCENCQYFDRVLSYREFYFYHLIVVFGVSYERRFLCDGCVASRFWRAFLLNLLFVLGVPHAIWMKIKSLRAPPSRLKPLSAANRLAAKGRLVEATRLYHQIQPMYQTHPGVLHDQAMAHLVAGDAEGARNLFEQTLRSCANYLPTGQVVAAIAAAQDAQPQ